MITTKFLKISLILIFFISIIPSSQGQILKRLKRKIERKIENKVEREVDKTIDDAIEGKPKNEASTSNEEQRSDEIIERNTTEDFGDVNISSNNHESIGIGKLGKVKVIQNGDTYRISGSWWTHSADIPDGFTLEIKNAITLKTTDNPQKTKFKIPEEATLHLAYDPSMPNLKPAENNRVQAVTDKYTSYNVSQGYVSIYQLDDHTIHFGFSGENGLKGSLQGQSPNFISEHSTPSNKNSSNQEASLNANRRSKFNTRSESAGAAGTYEFNYEFVNEIKTDKDKETYILSYLFNKNEDYFGMKVNMGDYSDEDMEGETIIIYDSGKSFILVDAQGMKIQMSSMGGQEKSMPSDQMANYDYSNIKKTGATKSILGYTCHEYMIEDKSNTVNLWIAPDFKVPNWFTQQNVKNQQVELNGYALEYYVQSEDGNISMKTTKINDQVNLKVIGSDYKKMF